VGALLGRHDGKQIVVEQAFECGSKKLAAGGVPMVDPLWFGRMVKLRKSSLGTNRNGRKRRRLTRDE
jgi:hypothetical protein